MGNRRLTKRHVRASGFTLLELMICTVILLIAVVAASPSLVGAQRSWQSVYDSVPAGLTRDGCVARTTLQRAARRASRQSVTIDPDAHWVDLPYYDSADSTQVDRYARLSWSEGNLNLREGQIDEHGERQTLADTVVCGNISDCVFAVSGKSVRMKLTFTQSATQRTVAVAVLVNNK